MRATTILLAMSVLLPLAFAAEPITERVREGNRLFQDNDLEGAMGLYQDARTDAPEAPELSYNIGNVYFHQKKLDDAVQFFQEALQKGEPSLKADAQFNLGNTYYRQAQQKESAEKLEEALETAKRSLDAYKQCRQTRKLALGRRFKESPDLNHNIQFAQREIRRIRDKILKRMKEQQKKQEQNKDQQQEQKQQEQKQQQQKRDASQQKKEEEKKQQGEDQKKQEKQQKAQRMTPEQAKAMLKQLSEEEKKKLKKEAMRYGGGSYVEKDW